MHKALAVTVTGQPSVYAVMSFEGELDVATAPELRQRLLDIVASPIPVVVVDLCAVDFVDSSILGAILTGWKAMNESGGAMVISAKARIARVFEITGIDITIPVLPTVAEALQAAGVDYVESTPGSALPIS